mmetsp:Transcript_22322/g.34546  ORF Transcript_22322/g.34546 Transcript_22322/m.34546 type:complete len:262 (-) Transcript_22322:1033-1818(-)
MFGPEELLVFVHLESLSLELAVVLRLLDLSVNFPDFDILLPGQPLLDLVPLQVFVAREIFVNFLLSVVESVSQLPLLVSDFGSELPLDLGLPVLNLRLLNAGLLLFLSLCQLELTLKVGLDFLLLLAEVEVNLSLDFLDPGGRVTSELFFGFINLAEQQLFSEAVDVLADVHGLFQQLSGFVFDLLFLAGQLLVELVSYEVGLLLVAVLELFLECLQVGIKLGLGLVHLLAESLGVLVFAHLQVRILLRHQLYFAVLNCIS